MTKSTPTTTSYLGFCGLSSVAAPCGASAGVLGKREREAPSGRARSGRQPRLTGRRRPRCSFAMKEQACGAGSGHPVCLTFVGKHRQRTGPPTVRSRAHHVGRRQRRSLHFAVDAQRARGQRRMIVDHSLRRCERDCPCVRDAARRRSLRPRPRSAAHVDRAPDPASQGRPRLNLPLAGGDDWVRVSRQDGTVIVRQPTDVRLGRASDRRCTDLAGAGGDRQAGLAGAR
jgi:hypothetical protein